MNQFKTAFMGSDKKVFRNFLVSYILIFAIPILLLTAVFLYVRNALEKNMENKVEASMNIVAEQMKGIIDDKLEISRALSYVAWNLEGLSYYRKNAGTARAVDLYRLSRQLKTMIIGTNFVEDMTLVVNKSNVCINTGGVFSKDILFEKLAGDDAGERQMWERELLGFTPGRLVRSGMYGKLYFIQTFPIAKNGDGNEGIFIIEFSHSVSDSILRIKEGLNGMELAILGEEGMPVFRGDGAEDGDGIANQMNGQEWLTAVRPSNQIPIQYAAAFPKALMKKEFQAVERVVLALFFIVVIAGCGVIYYVTLRNYNPIKQLFVLVNGGQPVVSRILDPYAEIRVKLLEAADKKMMKSDLEERQGEIRKRKLFFNMVKDRTASEEEIKAAAGKLDSLILKSELCMIKVKYADGGSYFSKGNVEELDKGQACANVCDTLLGRFFKNLSFVYRSNIYLLVLLNEAEVDAFHAEAREEMSKIRRFLQDSYDMDTIASVSDVHKGIKGLRKAVEEVDLTMESMDLTGTHVFLKYSKISAVEYRNKLQISASKEEVLLINHMKAAEYAEAKKVLNEMLEDHFLSEESVPHLMKFNLYALVGNILKIAPYMVGADRNGCLQGLEQELEACDTVSGFKMALGNMFDSLARQAAKMEEDNKAYFKSMVMDIVKSNYSNPDLNVSMIANIVNRNLDYVSRTFKKESGIGLLDYIHEVRMEKAKELLQKQNLTIQRISSMAGYSNCESFIRVFKRKEGITPGRYRERADRK